MGTGHSPLSTRSANEGIFNFRIYGTEMVRAQRWSSSRWLIQFPPSSPRSGISRPASITHALGRAIEGVDDDDGGGWTMRK